MLKTLVTDILEMGITLSTTHDEDTKDKFLCSSKDLGVFRVSHSYVTKLDTPNIYIYRATKPRYVLTLNSIMADVEGFLNDSPDQLKETAILAHEFGHWGSWMSQSAQQTAYRKAHNKLHKNKTIEDWEQETREEFRAWENALDYLRYREAKPEVLTYVQAMGYTCLRPRYIRLWIH